MLKYFIYQLKNNYKILVVNLLVVVSLTQIITEYDNGTTIISLDAITLLLIPGAILLGLSVMFSFYKAYDIIVGDLFRNTGYFTYTLPIKSYKILFSKILFALFYMNTILVAISIQTALNFRVDFLNILNLIKDGISPMVIININVFMFLSFIIIMFVFVKVYINSRFYAILITTITAIIMTTFIDIMIYNYDVKSIIAIALSCIFVLISGRLLDKKLDM
ncbi:hypothetical protein [Oceanivirga salmonicida]|uniref:hypothetical protein n=1 Tax=Oceanivirga salmonicida TaxID=1769291 RepID=UPI0008351457|nr:hypothetical protein [Oceanivirga salmonicida]